jgi:hypothetical protein
MKLTSLADFSDTLVATPIIPCADDAFLPSAPSAVTPPLLHPGALLHSFGLSAQPWIK